MVTLLDILQYHYDSTLDVIQQRVRDFGPSIDEDKARFGAESRTVFVTEEEDEAICCDDRSRELQFALKNQLVQLAENLFSMMNERIAFSQR